MPFARALEDGQFAVALEITPPQKALPGVLLRRARLLDGYAMAVNVIQRPGRQSSLEASVELSAAGLNPAWHLVTRGRTAAEIAPELETARRTGISQVLCIRGDHAVEGGTQELTIREAVQLARAQLPAALVGATFNQYTPDGTAALRNLLPKLAAGATYVQTQPVFELATLAPFAERIKARASGTRIIAMAMPLLTANAAERIAARLGIAIPPGFEHGNSEPEKAWDRFTALLASLFESPLIDGVAIMTFEMDAPPEFGARIREALRAAGVRTIDGGRSNER